MLLRACFIGLIAIVVLCERAHAQGTQGQLPDPISAARLSAYADMLALSPQQRHALNDLHAPYREEFQKLRDVEINEWLGAQRQGFVPRSYYTQQHDIVQRIAALDDRLFNAVATILTDEQNQRLVHVRQWRQRDRAVIQHSRGDAPMFDLLAAIIECGASPHDWHSIAPMLSAYHGEATSLTQRMADERRAGWMRTHDALVEGGITEDKLANPDFIVSIVEITRPITTAFIRLQNARTDELLSLNKHTIAALCRAMPGDFANCLQGSFLAVYGLDQMAPGKSPFAAALRGGNVTDEQRLALTAEADRFDADMASEAQRMMTAIDAHRKRLSAALDDDDRRIAAQDGEELERQGRESNMRVVQRHRDARTRVSEIIGSETAPVQPQDDPENADLSMVGIHRFLFPRSDISSSCPPRINSRDLETYRRWLRLDDARFGALQAAHQSYAAECDSVIDLHREPIRSAWQALHAGDSIEGYTRANLQRSRAAIAAAEGAQREVESRLLAAIAQELGLGEDDPGLARVRCSRERAWFSALSYNSRLMQAGGRHDGIFDVASLLLRMHGIDLDAPAVDAVLIEHEQAIVPLLQSRQEAVRRHNMLSDDLRVEWQELRVKTGERFPDMKARRVEAGEPVLLLAAKHAADTIAELNQATIKRLVMVLPAEQAVRVQRTFERMSWPQIYLDRSNAAPLLQAAARLDDLTAEQRSHVQDLAAAYFPEYDAMIEKMKASVEKPDSAVYDDNVQQRQNWQEQMAAFWVRNGERKRMLFDRHELNVRVWQRLKGILTEDQANAIGMPATPPEGPGEHEDFGS